MTGNSRRATEALEKRLGPAPRSVDWTLPKAPAWVRGDPLKRQWRHHKTVIREGRPVMAFVYMANESLFTEGNEDLPAGVVYSFDPLLQQHPTWLEICGQRLLQMHERDEGRRASPMRPWLRQVHDEICTGLRRPIHQRLPPELTRGPIVYHSSLLVFRSHLARGFLESMWLPLLVHQESGWVAQVPATL